MAESYQSWETSLSSFKFSHNFTSHNFTLPKGAPTGTAKGKPTRLEARGEPNPKALIPVTISTTMRINFFQRYLLLFIQYQHKS